MKFFVLTLLLTLETLCFVQAQIKFINNNNNNNKAIVHPDENLDLVKLFKITTRNQFNFPRNQDQCVTREGQAGACRSLRQCAEIVSFIGARRGSGGGLTNQDINFLRGRICGFGDGNDVKLCCLGETGVATGVATGRPPTPTSAPLNSQIPSTTECGITTVSKIVDGVETSPGENPWLTAVGYPRNNRPFRVLCGGTLITKSHVLTAAHCFRRPAHLRQITHVVLGEHSLARGDETLAPITLRIRDKRNPGYDNVSHVNDIELLFLERSVEFTTTIRPACLPFGMTSSKNFDDSELTIAGWGDTFFLENQGTDTPMAAKVRVVPKAQCRIDYRSQPQVPLDRTQLCAGKGTTDACQGDSGGPLIYQGRRFFLLGIVSFGIECANPNFPGVYTFIPEFLDWITDNL